LNLGFLGDSRVSSKRHTAAALLTSGTLAWFFLVQYNVGDLFASHSSNIFLLYVNPVFFYGFAVISAIVGTFICRKVNNRVFLFFWIALGVLSTALLPQFRLTEYMPFLSVLLGLSLGLGLPSSMAFIADRTVVEERARVSGTTIAVTFGTVIIAVVIARILNFDLNISILLYALVRSISLLALALDKFDREEIIKESLRPQSDYKHLVYYIIPWLMFILVGMLAWNLIPLEQYGSAVGIGQAIRFVCIAIFGLVSGFFADRFGRKPAIIIGLIVLGVSFAFLGFTMTDLSVIIYLTASGVAWGFFFAIYLAIPGDLSTPGSRERFYALINVLPLVLLGSVTFIPGLAEFTAYSSSFSQVLSLVLFLSIIPVLRTGETLPEAKIRERRLKEHVKKVGELVSESEKNQQPT